ncbi:hypothetical protein M2302_002215 [Micromonospora sp. A200]|uniref:hypothetical protein n=1 Tax=Micromonospora sp. A200 TaxID=2940568 RepID=UPI002474D165|nr:hypothetical protein [Micromonospora sp. A200]MDH6462040.1 hypothetical protein [Micromonospora sp. A200]
MRPVTWTNPQVRGYGGVAAKQNQEAYMIDHELAKLIEKRRKERRESYGDIADRGGEHLSKSYVHKLATTDRPPMPKPEQITALSAALEVPEDIVLRAAQQSAGYHVYETETPDTGTRILISNIEKLTPAQQASVAALVEHHLRELGDRT